MFSKNSALKWGGLFLIALVAMVLISIPCAQAQYWSAMPPYNLLWPLWSPVYSPADPLTGVATPLLSSLSGSTTLPVSPAMVWDPSLQFPWLLYNIPSVLGGGLTFFDPYYGLNPFPPPYLIDSGLPLPITLPLGYDLLPPTDIADFGPFVTQGNLSYALQYPVTQFGLPLSSLLTPAQIWGLPLI